MSQESAFKVTQLPPRLRQVHELLLVAESEKRIAIKLGLSAYTVHDHVKELYRRAGVNTRAEYLVLALTDQPPKVEPVGSAVNSGTQMRRTFVRTSPRPSLSLLQRLVKQVSQLNERRNALFDRIAQVAQSLKRD